MHLQQQSVNEAFSKQSFHFDEEDVRNPVLTRMRKQVYDHVKKYLKPQSNILELNAGTGIDATHFVQQGHRVHATDLADGMISQIEKKIIASDLQRALSCQHLSYTELNRVNGRNFDNIFSNFGGLNCVDDLKKVTQHFPGLLRHGGYITLVIMPVVCPWEIAGVFRNGSKAFRRFHSNGVVAHLEGKYFQTYYHSLSAIKAAFDSRFVFVESEGLASLSPPPHQTDFPSKHPQVNKILERLDLRLRKHFPFDRWGDHLIVTFQYRPE